MSQFVEVKLDAGPFTADLRAMEKNAPGITARALNRAGTSGRAAMVKAIGKDTGIAAKNIRDEIRLDKANKTNPSIRVEIRGRRIPLIAFGARGPEPSRGRGRGVSYRLPGGRGNIPTAFIATTPSGHRGVFVGKRPARSRKGKGLPRSSPALPIYEKFGPSLPHVFEKFLDVFRKAASEAWAKTVEHEIDFARTKAA